ncbi:hypothetical protein BDV95DRAFT_584030 [Massariosphaeria phaeospora]|uniref:DUF2423 domain-containing protein n=1 Tax=Massariosphaeria phaeospora TaxID=100035 RepID=A0A7C8MGF6_9PLEO|nr:hypothetical protein BDV95DRAFT_584030 [Massariosphaeria phaeospora]
MAKGLRSSVKKSNRTKLRARVFRPVEDARAERLHAKLLDTLQQPKREQPAKKTEMDIDDAPATAPDTDDKNAQAEFPKGSCFFSAEIPDSFFDYRHSRDPPAKTTPTDRRQSRNLYLYLGLCSDVAGFTSNGDLTLAYEPLDLHWLGDSGLTVKS